MKAIFRLPLIVAVGLSSLSVLAMMALIFLDVLGKFIFNMPIPGTAEIVAAYFMVACVFLPLPYLEAVGRPIFVDILTNRLSLNAQRFFEIIACSATIVLYAIYCWQYVIVSLYSFQIREYRSGTWDVVVWPSKLLIPLGLAIAVLVIVVRIWELATLRLQPGEAMIEEERPKQVAEEL